MTQLAEQYSGYGYTHKDNLTKDEKMHYCSARARKNSVQGFVGPGLMPSLLSVP